MEEIVAGESEDKLLVPLPRLCKGLLPVSPAMPAFNTVEAGKIGGNWGQTFPCFLSWSPQSEEKTFLLDSARSGPFLLLLLTSFEAPRG